MKNYFFALLLFKIVREKSGKCGYADGENMSFGSKNFITGRALRIVAGITVLVLLLTGSAALLGTSGHGDIMHMVSLETAQPLIDGLLFR